MTVCWHSFPGQHSEGRGWQVALEDCDQLVEAAADETSLLQSLQAAWFQPMPYSSYSGHCFSSRSPNRYCLLSQIIIFVNYFKLTVKPASLQKCTIKTSYKQNRMLTQLW